MDGLERLAGNPVADKGVKGVLLCNPTPNRVTFRPVLPAEWFRLDTPETERTIRAGRMYHHNRSWGGEFPGSDAVGFGPIELPAALVAQCPAERTACRLRRGNGHSHRSSPLDSSVAS